MSLFLLMSLAILAACTSETLDEVATANSILIESPTVPAPPTETVPADPTTEVEQPALVGSPTQVPPTEVGAPTPTLVASLTPLPTETPPEPTASPPPTSPAGGGEVGPGLAAVLVRPEQWRPNLGDIALVRADGSGLQQLTDYRYNADPVLSPDGRRIAYRSVPSSITSLPEPGPRLADGYYNIWVITSDGTQA